MKCTICNKRLAISKSVMYANRYTMNLVRTHTNECEDIADRDTRLVKGNN